MKLLIHIIRKDAKFLRIFWALWILLLAAQVGMAAKLGGAGASSLSYGRTVASLAVAFAIAAALEYAVRSIAATRAVLTLLRIGLGATLVAVAIGLGPVPIDPRRFETLLLYFGAMGAAWMALAYILSAALILQDSPVGTKMFWATRPISGSTLLASKLLSVFLFLIVPPALVWLPWRSHCGYTALDLVTESLISMAWATVAVGPAVVLATLAGTGPRFMLYNVVGFVAVLTLGMVMAARSALSGHEATNITLGWGSLLATAMAATAVVTQFRSRRWTLSMGQFLLGIALGLAVGACVPADASVKLHGPSMPVAFAPAVQVTSAELWLEDKPGEGGHLTLQVRLHGVPDGVAWAPGKAALEVRGADGSAVALPEMALQPRDNWHALTVAAALGVPVVLQDPETEAKEASDLRIRIAEGNKRRAEKGEAPIAARTSPAVARDPQYAGSVAVTPETARRLRAVGTTARVHLTFGFARPRILFEMPFEDDQRRASGGLSARIVEAGVVQPKGWPGSLTPLNPRMDAGIAVDRPTVASLELYTVERAAPGGVFEVGRNNFMTFANSSSFFERIDLVHLSIPEPQVWRTNQWVGLSDWMQSTRLVAVRFENIGFARAEADIPAIYAPVFPPFGSAAVP